MTDRERAVARPLEETPEAAAAVEDDTTVPQLITDGERGRDNPVLLPPGATGAPGERRAGPAPETDTPTLISPGPTRGPHELRPGVRTGAEQPWEPEDLATADGHDPTPENVERARRELEQNGPAAIEKTVP